MQGQIVLSLVILQKAHYAAFLARPMERGAKAVKHHISLGRRVFRGLGAARCPITLGADQSIFGATRRGPMRAHIAGLDLAPCPCTRKWPWTSGNGGRPGLLPFSADRFGNDLQPPFGNQGNRHFHMSTISTPYGGPACPGHGRPAQGRRGWDRGVVLCVCE
jgi:hypothetical protein